MGLILKHQNTRPDPKTHRINIIDEESWYLTSEEPIGEDDNDEEMELDTEITKADYDKIVQSILQRKLVFPLSF